MVALAKEIKGRSGRMSFREIAEELKAEGFVTPSCKRYSASDAASMLGQRSRSLRRRRGNPHDEHAHRYRFGLDKELKRYRPAVDLLLALNVAQTRQDLSPLKNVGLHKLKGDRAGQGAMTENARWRICFSFRRYTA
jgi:proteic killer suppression protein